MAGENGSTLQLKGPESTQRALRLLGAGDPVPAVPVPIDPNGPAHRDSKGVDTFLQPKMPGRFAPSEVRKRAVVWRQARFLQVYSASMGNGGLARYYAAWSFGEYRRQLETNKKFAEAVKDAESEIADRATLILYSDLGLVENVDVPPSTRRVASAVLARLVEGLHARTEQLPIDGPRKGQKQRRVEFRP